MKYSFLIKDIFLIAGFSFFFLFFITSLTFGADSYTIAAGESLEITEFEVCQNVKNYCERSLFVPTKISTEWSSFREKPPLCVNLENCDPCDGITNVKFSYAGSGVIYNTVASAGKCWLDRNLGASQVAATSSDSLAYGDLFQWGREDDGHQKRNSPTGGVEHYPGGGFILTFAAPYDWRISQNDSLWEGGAENNPCPPGWRIPTKAEWENEFNSWEKKHKDGAFESPLKLVGAGYRHVETGKVKGDPGWGYYWSSTPSGAYAYYLDFDPTGVRMIGTIAAARGYGNSARCILYNSSLSNSPTVSISVSPNPVGYNKAATLTWSSTNANSCTASGAWSGSKGISGSQSTGKLISKKTYTLTCTGAGGSAKASITVNVNEWECGDDVIFDYKGSQVTYGSIQGSYKCWLDRNLGASRRATGRFDTQAYGDYFQWGRLDDKHQNANSAITTTTSSTNNPGHNKFIVNDWDWRNPSNNSLWQGVSGANNPCPSGWRVPTFTDWNNELNTWSPKNPAGAFNKLKLTLAGRRDSNGVLGGTEISAVMWHSTLWYETDVASALWLLETSNKNTVEWVNVQRSIGALVRCVKN